MNFETNRVSQIKLYIILDSLVLILPFLIGLPITLAEKRYDDLFIMLSIYIPLCIVVIGQFIFLRKYYLGKVFVNDEGVGYKYKYEVYKLFKWEEIIKVEIGNECFVFYKDQKMDRGKNIVEMKYLSTNKNYSTVIETCKQICRLINLKQKENGVQVRYTSEHVRKIFEQ